MSEKTEVVERENNFITEEETQILDSLSVTGNNKVVVVGQIQSKLEYSHEIYGEEFYSTKLKVRRISGKHDFIPLIISEWLIKENMVNGLFEGKWVQVEGRFRSKNKMGEDGKSHLELFLFVKKIEVYETESELTLPVDTNMIYLDGYICKDPVFRLTPLGCKITDVFMAVNRKYSKESDYIPCIAWEGLAEYVSYFDIGTRIEILGRIQSRQYFKRYSPNSNEGEYREVYEISIMRFRQVEEESDSR